MLNILRSFSNSWLSKAFLALVMLCFIFIWGVPLYKVSNIDAIMKAGSTTTSSSEFIFQLNKYLYNLSSNMGITHRISAKEAEAKGDLNYFKATLNFNNLLDEQANELGLNLSSKKIAQLLEKDTYFQSNNKFDVNSFKNYLRNLSLIPSDIINLYKKEGQRQQLTASITHGFTLPQIFFDKAGDYFNEKYKIAYVTISNHNLLPIAYRDDNFLQKWYDLHKKQYMSNETRSVEFFKLTKADIKIPVISDTEIANYYNKHIDKYTQAQTRTYDIISFNTKAEASKALAKLDDTFKTNKNIQHKTAVKKSDLDAPLADAIFKLAKGGYTPIIENKHKFYIAKLKDIKAKTITPLNKVSTAIKTTLTSQNTDQTFNKTVQDINNKLKTTTSFADIAKTYNLPVSSHNLTKNSENIDKKNMSQANWDKLLRAIFHAEKGKNHVAIDIKDNGKAWYNLTNITKAKQKTFNEVKEEIKHTIYLKDKAAALDKRALELKKELDHQMPIEQLAQENNLKLETLSDIGRNYNKENVFNDFTIENILGHTINDNLIGLSSKDVDKRFIIKIIDIYNDKAKDKPVDKITAEQFNKNLQKDLLFTTELIANDKTPLIINKSGMERLMR